MKKKIDPKTFGLPPRTNLYQQGSDTFIISINRKSRIIMKDAVAILEKSETIKNATGSTSVILETNAPVCSKSTAFLTEHGVKIVEST